MSDHPDILEPPAFDWPKAKLMRYLADAWGMSDPSHIRVIGRLQLSETGAHGYLEGLHDAITGVLLPSDSVGVALPKWVYVSPSDLHSFDRRGSAHQVVAELTLSPVEIREQRNDPLACKVLPHSMVALSHVPDSWGVKALDGVNAPLLFKMAREAIDVRLQRETAEAVEQLERLRQEHASLQDQQVAKHKDGEAKKRALKNTLQKARVELRAVRDKVDLLQADFDSRREILENKLRDLEVLLRLRGERMVALDLVDRNDLNALIPEPDRADTRDGHDFQQVLGGDFSRLAPFIQARLWKKNMLFSQAQLRDFLALMRTNDLVVLAGDSGSGKTSLVRAVAESIGGHCTVIPVKPNWTGPEDLLGYFNPIERSYQATPFLRALQAAGRDPEVPHFICLDEMNLARVEHYFADFLSLLEIRDIDPTIALYTSDEEHHVVVENSLFLTLEEEARQLTGMADGATFTDLLKNQQANALLHQLGGFQDSESVLLHHGRLRRAMGALLRTPSSIPFPSNVRIIGAINIDETTHYLSPKVLDRAHVLRFQNPILMDWNAVEAEVEHFDVSLDLPVRLTANDLGQRSSYPAYDRTDKNAVLLTKLVQDHLDPLGVEFGLRAIRQSLGYMQAARQAGMDDLTAIDNVVQHKILPKLMLDTGRAGGNGTSKRELLVGLRDSLQTALQGLPPATGCESSVKALDRLIQSIDGNNGIANYWLR